MLISIKKEFCYIANTKVASTSMENVLKRISQIQLGGTPAIKHMTLHDLEHMVSPVLLKKGLDISNYYKFSVIRSPASWVISWFNYHSLDKFKYNKRKYFGNFTFDVFLEKVLSGEIKYISKGQSWRFESDNYIMDELICFENLDDRLEFLSNKFNMESIILPKLNVSTEKRMHTKDLTSKQKSLISEHYKKDEILYRKWLK